MYLELVLSYLLSLCVPPQCPIRQDGLSVLDIMVSIFIDFIWYMQWGHKYAVIRV